MEETQKENPKQKDNETKTPVKIDKERDEEESLNSTQNPLDDNELSAIIFSAWKLGWLTGN